MFIGFSFQKHHVSNGIGCMVHGLSPYFWRLQNQIWYLFQIFNLEQMGDFNVYLNFNYVTIMDFFFFFWDRLRISSDKKKLSHEVKSYIKPTYFFANHRRWKSLLSHQKTWLWKGNKTSRKANSLKHT